MAARRPPAPADGTLHWTIQIPGNPRDSSGWPWWTCMYQGRRATLQAFVPHDARCKAAERFGCLPPQVALESVVSAGAGRKKRPRRPKRETHGQLTFTIIDDGEEPPAF